MSKNLSGDLLYEILRDYDVNKLLSNNNYKYLNSNEYLIGKYLEQALEDKGSNFKYYFTCGITMELAPDNPVVVVHKIIYDKDGRETSRDESDQIYGCTSIEEWEKSNGTDPINRKPILQLKPVKSERLERLSECFEEYRNKLSDKEQEEVNKAIDGILNKKLIEAAKKDALSIMRQCLDNGADVNAKNDNGYTALLYHAYRSTRFFNNPETAKYLIDKGADIDAQNNYGDTPLLLALYNNRIELAKYLIDKGANVNAKDNNRRTPLLRAILLNNTKLAKYLTDKGADVNAKDINGYTPLFRAIGNTELVKHIIGKGVYDINARTDYGDTTLLFAVFKNDIESVKYLIDKGADVNAKDNEGKTPLDIAIEKEREGEMMELLIKHTLPQNSNMKKPSGLREGDLAYWNRYEDEISAMKEYKLGDGISLFDILTTSDKRKLALHMSNENIVEAFRSNVNAIKEKFPIYAGQIGKQCRKGLDEFERRYAVEEIVRCVSAKKRNFNIEEFELQNLNEDELREILRYADQNILEGDKNLLRDSVVPRSNVHTISVVEQHRENSVNKSVA